MKRRIRVLKFGGTSVASGERMRQVALIVAQKIQQQTEDFLARHFDGLCAGKGDPAERDASPAQETHHQRDRRQISRGDTLMAPTEGSIVI